MKESNFRDNISVLFSPLCRVTAKYKHASCMHVGEAASRDKKNNVKVEIWIIMQKPILFSEKNEINVNDVPDVYIQLFYCNWM